MSFFKKTTRTQKQLIIVFISVFAVCLTVVIITYVLNIENRAILFIAIALTLLAILTRYVYVSKYPKKPADAVEIGNYSTTEQMSKQVTKSEFSTLKTILIVLTVLSGALAIGAWFIWVTTCLLLGHC